MKKLWIILMLLSCQQMLIAKSPPFISNPARNAIGYAIINLKAEYQHDPSWADSFLFGTMKDPPFYDSHIYNMAWYFRMRLITQSGKAYQQRGVPFIVKVNKMDQSHNMQDYFPSRNTFDIWNEITPKGNRFGYMTVLRGREIKQEPELISKNKPFDFAKVILTDTEGDIVVGVGVGYPKVDNFRWIDDPNDAISDYLWPGSNVNGNEWDRKFVCSRVEFLVGPYKKDHSSSFITDDPNEIFEPEKLHVLVRRHPSQDVMRTRNYTGWPGLPIVGWSYFSLTPSNTAYGVASLNENIYTSSYSFSHEEYERYEEYGEISTLATNLSFVDKKINNQIIAVELDRYVNEEGVVYFSYSPILPEDEINILYNFQHLDNYSTYTISSEMEVYDDTPINLFGYMTVESGLYDPNLYDPNLLPEHTIYDPNDYYHITDRVSVPVFETGREGNISIMSSSPLIFTDDPSIKTGISILSNGVEVYIVYTPENSQVRMVKNSPLDWNGDNVIDIQDLIEMSYYWLQSLPYAPFNFVIDGNTIGLYEFSYLASEWLK